MQRIQPDNRGGGLVRLRTLVIVTNAKGALLAETVGPEALNGSGAKMMLEETRFNKRDITDFAMVSWVKRSQKPKTGLARTSRTA